MAVSRREFLASATALPVLASLRGRQAFAEPVRLTAPYLALEGYIEPGHDEFPEERAAEQLRQTLEQALRTGKLPNELPGGISPWPASYRQVAPDIAEAIYNQQDKSISAGWARWVRSLKNVMRAEVYPLADGWLRFEISSDNDGKLVYRTGRWKVKWADGQLLEFRPFEELVATAAEPWFRDVTGSAFRNVSSFTEQLAKGIPYWRAKLDPASGIDIYGSNGIAVGDLDGDGSDEIYVCQPGGLPNRLYKCGEDGVLADITETWNCGLLDDTSAALFLDIRNSGRQDLIILRSGGPVLLLNAGSRFHLRENAFQFATRPTGTFTGLAAADYDRDGRLDLYLCCYVYFQSEAQYTYASPYHDAQNGPPNFLFRNRLNADGSGFFEDVTAQTGMNENNNRFSFAPAWCDTTGDGWPDLYVANDFGRKNLYVNHGGQFRDKAAEAGVEDIGPGMSAAWFDYDGDGKPDLYVANMWTAAGQRVTADAHFMPGHGKAMEEAYHRHTMGNSLYRNRGDGTFENRTAQENVHFGRWAWSSGGHDFDNDGQAEIFVTCGMLTNTSKTDLSSFFWRQVVAKSPDTHKPSAAYENGWNAINQFIREEYSWNGREPNVLHVKREERYFDFSGVSGLDFADDSRAFAVTDFDNDGRPDVVLKSRLGPQVRVLQNNCAGKNQAIAFELTGTKSNRDAIGARVRVDGQAKWLEAGSGFLSQHSKRLLFGLGAKDAAKQVEVSWPSGNKQTFTNLRAGRIYRLTEGSAETAAKTFKARKEIPEGKVTGDNELHLHDTWLLEPVPLPEKQAGSRLFVMDRLPDSADKREQYEIFRRYLFDWRTAISLPLTLLLNENGAVVKIYAATPSEEQVRRDLSGIREARRHALPFRGFYVSDTHRDFFKFGAAYLWAGYAEEALPYLNEVLRRNPDNARVLTLIGQIHLQANRSKEAQKTFEEALRVNGEYAEAWSGLGDVDGSRGEWPKAFHHYERALSLKHDLLYTLINAGRCADKLQRPQEAQSLYQRALDVDGQSAEAANGLGLTLAKQGRQEEARKLFEKAIELKRDYSEAINNLGVLYVQEAKVNDAIAAFEYGIRVAPDEDILYLNLGRTYTQMGNREKARQVMQQLLQRKPDSATARHALQELESR